MLPHGESCKDCYYFRPDSPSGRECHGDCLRYPPQTLPLEESGSGAAIETVQVKILLNRTHSTFACGEFRSRQATDDSRAPSPGRGERHH